MGKCYFTELPVAINNSSLRVYGQAKIKATSATKVSAWIQSNVAQTVKVYAPDGSLISETLLVPNNRATIGVADMSGYDYVTYIFEDYYNISEFYGHTSPDFGGASDSKYYVKLSEWSYSDIETLQDSYASSSMIFVEDNFHEPIYLPNMDKPMRMYNSCDDIAFLAGCTAIPIVESANVLTTPIKGEWTEVLAAMCANERVSGTLNVNMYSNYHYATFNGIVTGAVAFIATFSESGCVVTDRIQFTQKTGYTSATYNKATGEWTFETA